jgi:hypothetical protein
MDADAGDRVYQVPVAEDGNELVLGVEDRQINSWGFAGSLLWSVAFGGVWPDSGLGSGDVSTAALRVLR